MADRVVTIDGVSHAFPADATDAEISAALNAIPAPNAAAAPKARTWTDTAVDLLPAAGGAIGGIVGGIGGTVAGVGVGGVPGAVGGAALGGAAGEAGKQLINRLRGAPAPSTMGDAAKSIGTQAAVQGGAELAGAGVGKVISAAAPRVMQSALKPTLKMLGDVVKGQPVPRVVQTLLDEGVNVSPAGYQKLQAVLNASTQERNAMIQSAMQTPGSGVDPLTVTSRLVDTAKRFGAQVTPKADLEAITKAGQEFLENYTETIPLDRANAIKTGTYDTLRKKYGQLGSAETEAQKALARGLKEEIEYQVPGVDAVNRRVGDLGQAAAAVGRRVAVSTNRDVGGISLLASNPAVLLASIVDRHPAVKSLIARGMYQAAGVAAKVSPQLIRSLVVAVSTNAPGDGLQTP